ncbi:chorismate mutase [Fervidicella metallireducens AeB]|uniref:chorismate mutase n=1 Tax=Fervidicella metallireducens AeB TaxID=1403537 RepID=A0A017RUM6_9CLOT|nr:chorismate mutase [Fervidicella metallireducens]EYE88392.1 chorismate mutase [Fervidicella metallireducens AeB]
MYSVRGAITVENDTKEEILNATEELLKHILDFNKIEIKDIISVIFSCTKDLKSVYPAEAARKMGILHASLLCLQEMFVEGSMEKCIRILMFVNENKVQSEVQHVFLKEAKKLRPDLMKEFF